MKYTESKLTTAAHKQEVAIQAKIQKEEVDKNIYCVIEQNILSKTSKIRKAFNTEEKAQAFARSITPTADYNLVIEPIKLE